MRYASMLFVAAVSCLAGVIANAPAKAAVFDFSFISTLPAGTPGSGNATGTFTTGAASPTDPGYDLLTSLTFNTLSGVAPPPFSFTDQVALAFEAGSAFNPTTDAFINHLDGFTLHNIGDFPTQDVEVFGESFSQGSPELAGSIGFLPIGIVAPLVITQIPEPSTWAMMLLGLGGLGFLGYRQTRKSPAAAA
jgi:hypothetical protein